MSKKTGVFDVNLDLNELLIGSDNHSKKIELSLEKALKTVTMQMKVSGLRERTISDYNLHVNHFAEITNVEYLSDISTNKIYEWLDSMEVSNATKLIRLKCLKAFLGKCFSNGWIKVKFWNTINIKVDKAIKKGATRNEIEVLLSLLDLKTFVGLRDAVAILTLYQTGIRINTLGLMEEKHLCFDTLTLNLDGSILKNHKMLQLPIDKKLAHLLKVLLEQNEKVKRYYNQKNKNVFISQKGTPLVTKSTNNAISKQLNKYANHYGLQNVNPHAIRRGYAKNLLEKGCNIALISKALGHSDLSVTTQYLDLEVGEVASNLREFL